MQAPQSTEIDDQSLPAPPNSQAATTETASVMKKSRGDFFKENHAVIINAVVTFSGFLLTALSAYYMVENSIAPLERQRGEKPLLNTELDVQQTTVWTHGSREISIGVLLKNEGYSSITLDSIQVVFSEAKLTEEAITRLAHTTTTYPDSAMDKTHAIAVHRSNPDLSWTQITRATEETHTMLQVNGKNKYWFKFILQSLQPETDHSDGILPFEHMRWYHAEVRIKLKNESIQAYNYYFSREPQHTIVSETAKRIILE